MARVSENYDGCTVLTSDLNLGIRFDPNPVIQGGLNAPRNRTLVQVLLFGSNWAESGTAAYGLPAWRPDRFCAADSAHL